MSVGGCECVRLTIDWEMVQGKSNPSFIQLAGTTP